MAWWTVRDDAGSEDEFDAESEDEAKELAEDWVRDGEWGTAGAVVLVDATSDEDDSFVLTVEVEPDENAIDEHDREHQASGHTHRWESPHDVVGGCTENPGVWALGGVHYGFLEVCRCGAHRHTHSPVTDSVDMPRIEYPFGLWPREDCPEWFSEREE